MGEGMKLLGLQVNKVWFATTGTKVELGYYYKPSDDEYCDDVTMGSTDVYLRNEDVVPFLDAIIERSKEKLTEAAMASIENFGKE